MPTRADLDHLMAATADPAVSIFLPLDLPGPGVRRNAIRLDNLLAQAQQRLLASGRSTTECAALLDPVRKEAGSEDFWKRPGKGLALYLAPGTRRWFRLPIAVEELVVVCRRFVVSPLLPLFRGQGGFLVLALTADEARVFRADRSGMEELRDLDLPAGVASVRAATDYEQTVHSTPSSSVRGGRAGAGPSSVPAEQNLGASPEDLRKATLLQYLNKVAAALKRDLDGMQMPLVLAAQAEVAGNFRKQSELRNLWPEHVEVNPAALSPAELHARALKLVEARLDKDIDDAVAHFNSLFNGGNGRASVEAAELVKAARWGRMDTLILGEGAHVWGRFDEGADRVEAHLQPEPTDDDLLDLAAQLTLTQGGQVKVVPRDAVPCGAPAAGILRF